MRNPLNDPEAFTAVCAGAGGAFGTAACITLGESYSASFARLSIIMLIISAAMYITLRLADKLNGEEGIKNSSSPNANQTELETYANQKDCNISITDILPNVKCGDTLTSERSDHNCDRL